jgi:hypothetical protein
MPEGKANKGMMDIWVGKHSMRRNGERTIVLYFITLGSITKSEPDSCLRAISAYPSGYLPTGQGRVPSDQQTNCQKSTA